MLRAVMHALSRAIAGKAIGFLESRTTAEPSLSFDPSRAAG
jgi:hypothetical protein